MNFLLFALTDSNMNNTDLSQSRIILHLQAKQGKSKPFQELIGSMWLALTTLLSIAGILTCLKLSWTWAKVFFGKGLLLLCHLSGLDEEIIV